MQENGYPRGWPLPKNREAEPIMLDFVASMHGQRQSVWIAVFLAQEERDARGFLFKTRKHAFLNALHEDVDADSKLFEELFEGEVACPMIGSESLAVSIWPLWLQKLVSVLLACWLASLSVCLLAWLCSVLFGSVLALWLVVCLLVCLFACLFAIIPGVK